MQVKLTVPSDLGGASLLGVHNWIKSQVARSNPGGSPDYTIMDMNGNQLTLSDVARNPNTEIMVNVIDGIRSNPQGYLAPVAGLEMEYPQLPRSGNDVMMLMPEDLDPTLVQRIVAEQGLNRGLHTLNRLLLMQSPGEAVSPQTAAILQMGDKLRMSRAVRSNPSDRTPFTQRTPHYYSPEAALGRYITHHSGSVIEEVPAGTERTLAADARLANKYGLNEAKIEVFARNVLAEYLFAASANRGLLRTIVRNNPDLREERELMQRLLAIFPQQPKAFYQGSVNVFVANPLFIYPAYADTLLTNRQINTILDFARDYPHNMRGRRLPRAMSSLVYNIRGRNSYWSRVLNATLGRRYLFGSPTDRLDSATDLDDQIEAEGLRRVTRRFANDPEARRQEYFRRFATDRPVAYFSNLGGMYPTVPSKWPPALVYAIMDGFLEKLGEIVNMEDPTQFGFSPIRMLGTIDRADAYELEIPNPFLRVPRGEGDNAGVVNWTTDEPNEANRFITLQMPANFNTLIQENITWDQIRQLGFNLDTKAAIGRDMGRQVSNNEARAMLVDAIARAERNASAGEAGIEGTLRISSTGQISLLEMAYHIAEIAQVKYNYNARGDDFMFIMAMCQVSLTSLRRQVAPAADPLAGLIAPVGGGGPGPIMPPEVAALPGPVMPGADVPNDDVAAAELLNMAEQEPEIVNMFNEGEVAEFERVARQAGAREMIEILQAYQQQAYQQAYQPDEPQPAQLGQGNNLLPVAQNPGGVLRNPAVSAKAKRAKQLLNRIKSTNAQLDRRVVMALRGALNQDAHDFLDQVSEVSILTVHQASVAFDSSLKQLVATYKECIEQITDAIDEYFNSIFESEGKNLKYNYETLAQIYQALNAADAMATNAKLRFESKLEGFRKHTNVIRGIAGASPGVVAAIQRAIAVDTSSTDIIIELDDVIEFIQEAEAALNTDGITGDNVLRVYRALLYMADKLAEMLEAIYTLNKAIGKGEDKRSTAKVVKSVKEILEVIEHDIKTLDPVLHESQVKALRDIKPESNYSQLKRAIDDALAVL